LSYSNKEILLRFDPNEYGSQNSVKKQREWFRNYTLNSGADYLMFIGADTLPPADVLERLLKVAEANRIKIIGGVYWGRHGADNGNTGNAVAWIHEMSQEEQSGLFKQPNSLVKVDGMGMDMVLIHREVLEKINWLDYPQNDDDYPIYDKIKGLGYDIYIDTSLQAKHYFSETGYSYLGKKYVE